MSIPNIVIKHEGSSRDGWCVNYKGFYDRLKPITHCRAGVEYKSVETPAEFTISYGGESHRYAQHSAHPCFKREHGFTKGCPHCQFPTPEEIKAHRDEAAGRVKTIVVARSAILAELDRRHKDGDSKVQMNARCNSEYDSDGPTSFISGSGAMECPACKTGKLRYSRAAYNGHVHAHCTTENCASWME